MKFRNSMPANGSAAPNWRGCSRNGALFLYELSHCSAGKLYKTDHSAE
jgi:hypothetical protein